MRACRAGRRNHFTRSVRGTTCLPRALRLLAVGTDMQKSPALRGQRVDKTEADSRVQRGCSCGAPLEYSQQYDADFCRRCDCWRESACRDPACEFCARRPARPRCHRAWSPSPTRHSTHRGSEPQSSGPPQRRSAMGPSAQTTRIDTPSDHQHWRRPCATFGHTDRQ